MRTRTAVLAAAGIGASVSALAGWSLVQNPRVPVVDQERLWGDDAERLAVVLGIGGVPGAAWEAATLARLCRAGLDVRRAGLVVGTSAGSLAAVTLRSGLSVDQFEEFAAFGSVRHRGVTVTLPDPRTERRVTAPLSSPVAQVWHALGAHRLPHVTSAVVQVRAMSGFSLASVGAAVDALWQLDHPADAWPAGTWVVATDAYNGQRVVFGAAGAPTASLGQAVAASCAAPGLLAPVAIGDRWYVDGGVVSFTSVDLAVHAGARRIVVLNPMAPSGFAWWVRSPLTAAERAVRELMARSFQAAVRSARHHGVEVLVVTPSRSEAAAIGPSLLDFSRGAAIVEAVAARAVREPTPTFR